MYSCKSHGFNLNVYYLVLTQDVINEMHNAHLKVAAWTVNSQNLIDQLVNMGIDYILTDGPTT